VAICIDPDSYQNPQTSQKQAETKTPFGHGLTSVTSLNLCTSSCLQKRDLFGKKKETLFGKGKKHRSRGKKKARATKKKQDHHPLWESGVFFCRAFCATTREIFF